ncbi:spore cortex biosynthesis protein YabQ [Paenibacillus sp. S3N08]|uniref:Spore cortex biosynthesis protein YabQ n=2 Tax=Paenibacillus agricola TaxID=2716264 RepID=A0ABX0JF23_9BACL|nr:spore cortex biosynthesis protein YabQ [Paenibacillus agricola]
MTLHIQFATMGMMMLGGLSLGGLFDLYRVLANYFRMPRYAYYFWDVVFWILGTLLIFKLLYDINWGQVRLFIFIGLLVGMVVYFWLFSGLVVKLVLKLIQFLKFVIQIGVRAFKILIIVPISLLYRACAIFFGFLFAIAIFLYQVMLQLLYTVWKLLLWLISPMARRVRMMAKNNKTVQVIARFIHRLFDRT